MTQLYIYVYILFNILFHYGLSWDIEYKFPVLDSRTLLFIHPVYHSLHLLIPKMSSREPTLGNDLLGGAQTFPHQRGIPGARQVNRDTRCSLSHLPYFWVLTSSGLLVP